MKFKFGIPVSLVLAATLLISFVAPAYAAPDQTSVVLPDPALNRVVHETLHIPLTQPLFRSDLLKLTRLEAIEPAVKDLTGLEYALNLTWLELSQTGISDISPLSKLYGLQYLGLANCGLLNDIRPLQDLFHLRYLNLSWCNISDITPLFRLVNLQTLQLGDNFIRDIHSLLGNPGLGTGDLINLDKNPLDTAPGSQTTLTIQTLIQRGAQVFYPPYPNNYP